MAVFSAATTGMLSSKEELWSTSATPQRHRKGRGLRQLQHHNTRTERKLRSCLSNSTSEHEELWFTLAAAPQQQKEMRRKAVVSVNSSTNNSREMSRNAVVPVSYSTTTAKKLAGYVL
jgi:hypothetical protein